MSWVLCLSAVMSVEIYENYFRIADVDKDGKISGAEAVAFFRHSGLPQPVLAQVNDTRLSC